MRAVTLVAVWLWALLPGAHSRCFDVRPGTGDRSSTVVSLAARSGGFAGSSGLSHVLVHAVVDIFLREYLGYSTEAVDLGDTNPLLVYEQLAAGDYDVDMEHWMVKPSSAAYQQHVETDASVLVADIGYGSRFGIYVASNAATKPPFSNYHPFYKADKRSVLKESNYVMFGEDGLHEFLTSEGLEPICIEDGHCSDGPFRGYWCPPVCRGRENECAVVFSQGPYRDGAYFEQVVSNLNLSFIHAWAGPNMARHVDSLLAAGKVVVTHEWGLDVFLHNPMRILFPAFEAGCTDGNTARPDGPVACDADWTQAKKLFATTLRTKAPEAYLFVNSMQIYTDQMTAMIQLTQAAGGLLTPYDAACKWVQENQDVVTRWVPPCVIAPPVAPVTGDLVFDAALLDCKATTRIPGRDFAYNCDYGVSRPVGSVDRSGVTVRIARRYWKTQQYVSAVVGFLLRDFLGYNVLEVDVFEPLPLIGPGSLGEYVETGAFDLDPESWAIGRAPNVGPLVEQFIWERRTVLNPGPIGYQGTTHTYVSRSAVHKNGFTTWWEFYKTGDLTKNLNFLRFGDLGPRVPRLQDWVYDRGSQNGCSPQQQHQCNATGFEGFWVPPHCENDPASCLLVIHDFSNVGRGEQEQATGYLRLPFIHGYFGGHGREFITELMANGTYDFLYHGWQPDTFYNSIGGSPLEHPNQESGLCSTRSSVDFSVAWGGWNGLFRIIPCADGAFPLQKIASADVRLRAPEAYFMFDRLQLYQQDIKDMMTRQESMDWRVNNTEVGCWWVQKNLARVQSTYAPDCVSNPKPFDSVQTGDVVFDATRQECINLTCAPDEVLERTGLQSFSCRKCDDGTLPGEEHRQCEACRVGTIPNRSTGVCDLCPVGSQCTLGALSPEPCAHGTFAGEAGSTECVRCDWGRFQPSAGQADCLPCLGLMTTASKGSWDISECICMEGYYKPVNRTDAAGHPYKNTTEVCQPCPDGLVCSRGSDVANLPCGEGRLLGEADAGEYPRPLQGFYTECSAPLQVYRCVSSVACPGAEVQHCGWGYEGRACGRCLEGWHQFHGECVKCGSFAKTALLFPILPMVVAPCAIVLLYVMSRDQLEKWNAPANHLSSALFVGMVYIQTVAAINSCYIHKSDSLKSMIDWTEAVYDLLSMMRPACSILPDFTARFIASAFLPVYVAWLFAFVYLVSHLLGRFNQVWRMNGDITMNCYWTLFNTFFISICQQTFQLFQCYSHPHGGRSLRSSPDVFCGSELWVRLVAVATLAVLLFCGGFLALNIWLVCVAPKRFCNQRFRMRWKFIFIKYGPTCFWWSLVMLGKGIWLNLPTVIFDIGAAQLLWLEVGSLLYLCLAFTYFPWRGFMVGCLDLIVHTFIVALFGFLAHFVTPRPTEAERDALELAYGFLCLLPFVVLGVVLAVLLLKYFKIWREVSAEEWRNAAVETCAAFHSIDAPTLAVVMQSLPAYEVMTLQRAKSLIMAEFLEVLNPEPLVDTALARMVSRTRLRSSGSEPMVAREGSGFASDQIMRLRSCGSEPLVALDESGGFASAQVTQVRSCGAKMGRAGSGASDQGTKLRSSGSKPMGHEGSGPTSDQVTRLRSAGSEANTRSSGSETVTALQSISSAREPQSPPSPPLSTAKRSKSNVDGRFSL